MNENSRLENMSTPEFLAQHIYLPEFMVLKELDFDKKGGIFTFNAKEPIVARPGHQPNYLTLKGLPLCLAQAGYAIGEYLVTEEKLGDLEIKNIRKILSEGKIRIPKFYSRLRRQIKLNKPIQGRFDISFLKTGEKTRIDFNYDLENKSISGNFISMITNKPNPPMNDYAARN